MFTLETRIDGSLVAVTQVTRIKGDEGNMCKYSVEHHRLGKVPDVLRVEVKHDYTQGTEVLIEVVYKEIVKILNKDKS